MIESYLYKTIISFISLKAIIIMFREQWLKFNPKRNGFIKRNFNTLLPCLVPIFRWVWVSMVLLASFAVCSSSFAEKIKKERENNKND